MGLAATLGGGLAIFYLGPANPKLWPILFFLGGVIAIGPLAWAWSKYVPLVGRDVA